MTWFKKSIDGDDGMMNANSSVSRPEPRTPQQRAAEARIEPRPAETRPAELRPLEARAAEASPRASVLGPTLRFRGELSAQEDLIVQGSVDGSITHTQSLTIGAEGSMKGDIRARVIVVDGKVEGDLYATESVSIRSTAKVKGNVFAPRVAIAEGAFFQGQVEMQASGTAVQERSARLRQAAMSAVPLDGAAVDHMLSAS
jgi:cytoskeletal protein CcmA (bactofilin family)